MTNAKQFLPNAKPGDKVPPLTPVAILAGHFLSVLSASTILTALLALLAGPAADVLRETPFRLVLSAEMCSH